MKTCIDDDCIWIVDPENVRQKNRRINAIQTANTSNPPDHMTMTNRLSVKQQTLDTIILKVVDSLSFIYSLLSLSIYICISYSILLVILSVKYIFNILLVIPNQRSTSKAAHRI
jgi:hypothetical protein